MSVRPTDLQGFADGELGDFIESLGARIAIHAAQLAMLDTERDRSAKVARATFLTAGGFITAAFDLFGAILLILGLWDWIEVIRDDAATANKRLALRLELAGLELDLAIASAELGSRESQTPTSNP